MMRDMSKGESEMAEDEGWSYTVTARVRSCPFNALRKENHEGLEILATSDIYINISEEEKKKCDTLYSQIRYAE